MENEKWIRIPDWDSYEISDLGRVRSYKKTGTNQTDAAIPRVLKQGISVWGYPEVRLCNSGSSKKKRVHRLVAEVFLPNELLKREVNHKDGDKLNNKAVNLEWVSRSENMQHLFRVMKSPVMRGEKNGHAVLTSDDIAEIKSLWETGLFFQKEIASKFGIARTTVNSIVNGYNWKHLS